MANEVGGLRTRGLFPGQRQVGGGGDWDDSAQFFVNLDTVNALGGLIGKLIGNETLAKGDFIPTAQAQANAEAQAARRDANVRALLGADIVPEGNVLSDWAGLPKGPDTGAMPVADPTLAIRAGAPASGGMAPPPMALPEEIMGPNTPALQYARGGGGVPVMADRPRMPELPAEVAPTMGGDAGIEAALAMMFGGAPGMPGTSGAYGPQPVPIGGGLTYMGRGGTTGRSGSGANPMAANGRTLFQALMGKREHDERLAFDREKQVAAEQNNKWQREFDLLGHQWKELDAKRRNYLEASKHEDNMGIQRTQNDLTRAARMFDVMQKITHADTTEELKPALVDEYNRLSMEDPNGQMLVRTTTDSWWPFDETSQYQLIPRTSGPGSTPTTGAATEVGGGNTPSAAGRSWTEAATDAATSFGSSLKSMFAGRGETVEATEPGGKRKKVQVSGALKDGLEGRSEFESDIQRFADSNQLDRGLVRAMIAQESSFNPKAKSPTGPLGLMQLSSAAAKDIDGDEGPNKRLSPSDNVRMGTAYMARMMKKAGGNERLALVMYHDGPGLPSGAHGSPAARDYVDRVMRFKGMTTSTATPNADVRPEGMRVGRGFGGTEDMIPRVRQARQRGMKDEQIRAALAKAGASPEEIAAVLKGS